MYPHIYTDIIDIIYNMDRYNVHIFVATNHLKTNGK